MERREIVHRARYALDAFHKAESKWMKRGKKIGVRFDQCLGAGCNQCCKQFVLGSLVTGVLIADRLIEEDKLHMLRRVVDQGKRMSDVLKEHGPVESSDVWFDNDELCALVREDGGCSVYDIRPPACSTYFVQGGPEVCLKATSKTVVSSANNLSIMEMSFELDSAFVSSLYNRRFDDAITGPVGVQVHAGMKLLVGLREYVEFVSANAVELGGL